MRPSFFFEDQWDGLVVGLDEAGIGCWAGPVFAGAAWVPRHTPAHILDRIRDSKQLSPCKREETLSMFDEAGIRYATGMASLEEIEQLNIRGAALRAMVRAVDLLKLQPLHILVDGTMRPPLLIPMSTLVKGDQKSFSCAAASIAAKVAKDQHMRLLHEAYPMYGWATNQGYGTPAHQRALQIHGVSPHHRRTYAPIRKILLKETSIYVDQE